MKKLLIISICLLLGGVSRGQSYGDFMQQIIQKSPQMASLNAMRTADSLAARRGLNPVDPSVDMEYYFGKNQTMELTIAQEFDFPTVYHQRNKIARHSIERGEAEFMAARRGLLLEASELFNTLVYQTRLLEILEGRAGHYRELDLASSKAFRAGNVTAIEQSKLQMMLSATANELTEARAAQKATLASIKQLGVELSPENLDFARYNFSGTADDFISAAIQGDWSVQAARIDSLIAGRELKLARSEWAPGLKIGYKIEAEIRAPGAVPRHALVAGITLPLWQNRNNVKHSKAMITASSANLRATETNLRTNLGNLYNAYQAAILAQEQWANVDMERYRAMMYKTLKAGGIPMMQYLMELTSAQDTQLQILASHYRAAQLGGQIALYLY